jgi:hypothetical protein
MRPKSTLDASKADLENAIKELDFRLPRTADFEMQL